MIIYFFFSLLYFLFFVRFPESESLKNDFLQFKNIFDFVKSTHLQMKVIKSLDEYVEPEELLLGTRDEVIYKNGIPKMI